MRAVLLAPEYAPLAASEKETSPRKNRVGVFCDEPPGQDWGGCGEAHETAPGCTIRSYILVSGRPDFCNGDPVNFFDPNGRCGKGAIQGGLSGGNSGGGAGGGDGDGGQPPNPDPNGGNPNDPNKEDPNWTAQDRAAAKYADAVYGNDAKTGGLLEQLGIPYDPQNGFAAALYQEPDGTYYLAVRGTRPLSPNDWVTNAGNALDLQTSQYNQAIELAKDVQDTVQGKVILVGHSKGGGEVDAASYATGLDAITFNAAGLPEEYKNGTPGNIRAHYIVGDILTTSQYISPLPSAPGTQISHFAKYWGEGPVLRHLMFNFTNR